MSIEKIEIDRHIINDSLLSEFYGLKTLPLHVAKVAVTLFGIDRSVLNGIRRVLIDELQGYSLKVPDGGYDINLSNDPFMIHEFVNKRISNIPLKLGLSDDIIRNVKFKLDVTNDTQKNMYVYAGDLVVTIGKLDKPIFNPTFIIAELMPNNRLCINNIYISTGYGKEHANYQVGRAASYTHLDIPQIPEAEIKKSDLSGYTISCLVSNPKKHILYIYFPAVDNNANHILSTFARVCENIMDRLTPLLKLSADSKSMAFSSLTLDSGINQGILQIFNESYTIGTLLNRSIYSLYPNISFIETMPVVAGNSLKVTINDKGDVKKIFIDGIKNVINIYDNLRKKFLEWTVADLQEATLELPNRL